MTETLTVTERWDGDRVHWTARRGHEVIAAVTCPRRRVDSGVLSAAIREATGATAVRYMRKRSDAAYVVPRLVEITRED